MIGAQPGMLIKIVQHVDIVVRSSKPDQDFADMSRKGGAMILTLTPPHKHCLQQTSGVTFYYNVI